MEKPWRPCEDHAVGRAAQRARAVPIFGGAIDLTAHSDRRLLRSPLPLHAVRKLVEALAVTPTGGGTDPRPDRDD